MKKKPIPRAALYVRVSTADKQHPANQIAPLRQWAKKHGYRIVAEFLDRETGTTAARAQFQAMLAAAARHDFDLVVCWSLDRFSREGIAATFSHLKRLQANDVGFYSLTEEYFRTIGPAGELIIAVTAWVAEYETRRRTERIKAGLDRARAAGVWIGRRRRHFSRADIERMVELHSRRRSYRAIAAELETTKSTVQRRIQEELLRARWKKGARA